MNGKRTIGVLTGTRAEYGLLLPLMRLIEADPGTELILYVTGTHLLKEFGNTIEEIEKEKFSRIKKIDIGLKSDLAQGISESMGNALSLFGESFAETRPDLLVVLGDRYETFAVAAAATVAKIPIAHLHGGELTEGAMDEAFRHAITKMSHLHFTAAGEYRKRVIQLGEAPERVFNTGAIGIDNIKSIPLLSKEELQKNLGIKFSGKIFLITYHPETLSGIPVENAFAELLSALDNFPETTLVFTYPNADTNGRVIMKMIDEYTAANNGRAFAFASLGQTRYLSMMKTADVVIGNSSSGIIEAPALHTPTVNIGDRQKGRLRAISIIDCKTETAEIISAIKKAVTPEFKSISSKSIHPYGDGNTASRIFTELKSCEPAKLIQKTFYDLK